MMGKQRKKPKSSINKKSPKCGEELKKKIDYLLFYRR